MDGLGVKDGVVVVTGASKGIGRATAKAFLAAGANVVMVARSAERLEAEAAELGPGAVPMTADVGSPGDIRQLFAAIDARFGRLDVLVNNAGVAVLADIEHATDADINRSIATNLLGPIHTTRAAIPLFRRTGGGHVINLSSESTLLPFPFLSLYAATKAGLETFGRAAATELKPLGVRVTTVVCGATMTEFASEWDPDVLARFLDAAQESGHLAFASAGKPMHPDHVASALVFVATRPRGQIIDVIHVRANNAADPAEVLGIGANTQRPAPA